jgi:hypothetical protein
VAQRKNAHEIESTFVVAKENNFNVRVKERPRMNGVALDDADVPAERFRGGEDGKHCLRIARRRKTR